MTRAFERWSPGSVMSHTHGRRPGQRGRRGAGRHWAARQQAVLDKVGRFLAHVLTAIITLIVVSGDGGDSAPGAGAGVAHDGDTLCRGRPERRRGADPDRLRGDDPRLGSRSAAGSRFGFSNCGSPAPGGRVIATAPAMSVDLDPFALISGRIEPERVTLLAPLVRLVRNVEGGIELGLGGDAGEGDDLVDSWAERRYSRGDPVLETHLHRRCRPADRRPAHRPTLARGALDLGAYTGPGRDLDRGSRPSSKSTAGRRG